MNGYPNTRFRPNNWIVVYFCAGLGCDSPVLEALCRVLPWLHTRNPPGAIIDFCESMKGLFDWMHLRHGSHGNYGPEFTRWLKYGQLGELYSLEMTVRRDGLVWQLHLFDAYLAERYSFLHPWIGIEDDDGMMYINAWNSNCVPAGKTPLRMLDYKEQIHEALSKFMERTSTYWNARKRKLPPKLQF